jgi:hypothetical protein
MTDGLNMLQLLVSSVQTGSMTVARRARRVSMVKVRLLMLTALNDSSVSDRKVVYRQSMLMLTSDASLKKT